jgi:adenine-specific DNA-methyltransferase
LVDETIRWRQTHADAPAGTGSEKAPGTSGPAAVGVSTGPTITAGSTITAVSTITAGPTITAVFILRPVIKYLGSKKRLLPVLCGLAERAGARTCLDLFTGTTRVARGFKRLGAVVTAVDTARYSEVLARAAIVTDGSKVDLGELERVIALLDGLPGRAGYVTETFCEQSRFFQPHNGARIDAIRDAIASDYADTPFEPLLLASLLDAADRVDSTTGVQMAYVKAWAPRSFRRMELQMPELIDGIGYAVRGDACELAGELGGFDLAYLDPPYNQHRYEGNYHIWETLIAWDEPDHYGIACKRVEVKDGPRSAFNSRPRIRDALDGVVNAIDAGVLVLSYNDESWLSLDELVEMCSVRGHVEVLAFPSARYVGARIGIHNPAGLKVGEIGRLRNLEYVLVAGDRRHVEDMTAPWLQAREELVAR